MSRILELRIPPPLLALALAAGMWWLARVSPLFGLPALWRITIVLLLGFLGLAAAIAGVITFRRFQTTIHPLSPDKTTALVDTGIYRFSRNPMYLGMALVLLAWSVWLSAPVALLGPILFMAFIQRFQIIPEERALEKLFGEQFSNYRRRVRRWL